MLANWQDWCRFCSNTDAESVCKMDTIDELENVNKYFNLSLPPFDGIPLSVCQECWNFLTKFDGFRDRCLKANQMFKDLMHRTNLTVGDLKAIRIEYGLDEEEISYDQSVSDTTFVPRLNPLAIKGEIEIAETVIVKPEKPKLIPLSFLEKEKPNESLTEHLPAKKKKRMDKEIGEEVNARTESPEVDILLLPEKGKSNESLPESLPAKKKKRMDKEIEEEVNARTESPEDVPLSLPEKEKPKKSLSDEKKKKSVESLLARDLREYFRVQKMVKGNGANLLKKKTLNGPDRRKVINIVVHHILKRLPSPTKSEKIAYAKATIELFPCLKTDSNLGYDAVFNPISRTGYLENVLKTIKIKMRIKREIFSNDSDKNDEKTDEEEADPLPEKDMTMERVKDKLKTTPAIRSNSKKIFEEIGAVNVRTESPEDVPLSLPEKEKPKKSLSDGKKKKSTESLLARDLREYFRVQKKVKRNGVDFLKKRTLSGPDRRKVINIVAHHMLKRLPSPTKSEKIAYAKATIELFPCLKTDSNLGYDAVFNPINQNGYLGNVIRRIRTKMRVEREIFSEDLDKNDEKTDEEEADPLPEKDMTMERVKDKLKATPALRSNTKKIFEEFGGTANVKMKIPKVVLHRLPEKEIRRRSRVGDIASLPRNLNKSPPMSLPDVKKKNRMEVESSLARDLREYFRVQKKVKANGANLLKKKTLSILDRRKVINIVAHHMLKRLPSPTKSEKIAYAKATIELFPCLKIDSNLGYDGLYNPKTQMGSLGNVLKTIRLKMRVEREIFSNDPNKNDEKTDEEEADPLPEKDMAMERVKEKLKTTPALRSNIKKIFDGMDKTFEYRRKFVQSSLEINVLLEYPRFVDTYGLIQRDFEKSYPDQHNNLKDLYKKEFQELLHHLGYEKLDSLETKDWELPEIAALCWLSLLPPTCSDDKASKDGPDGPMLKTAFDCLLKYQFEMEEPPIKPTPTIIVQVDAKNEKKKYFVVLNGQSIPTNNTFVDALDILFKMHFVFNLEFELALRNFLLYLEYYVFGIRDKHSTNATVNECRMILISNDKADSGKPLINWV